MSAKTFGEGLRSIQTWAVIEGDVASLLPMVGREAPRDLLVITGPREEVVKRCVQANDIGKKFVAVVPSGDGDAVKKALGFSE